jgi:hypothetical protein
MKINTYHRFYAPVLKQIAELLKGDYEMKTDHTEDSLGGPNFSVIHKKYKMHGLNIQTQLSDSIDWSINGFCLLPLELHWSPKYEFMPERDDDNFPLLTPTQLKEVKTKIKAIEKSLVDEIMSYKDDLEDDSMQMGIDYINSYFNEGFDGLEGFKKYGIKVDYKEYLLNMRKKHITNFRILQGIFNSKTPTIRNLLEDAIDMYIDTMTIMSKDDAYEAANRFMTVDRENSLLANFTDANRRNYIEMVKEQFETLLTTDDPKEVYYDMVGFLRSIEGDHKLESEIMEWAYSKTQDEHFLSDEAKELFLF